MLQNDSRESKNGKAQPKKMTNGTNPEGPDRHFEKI